MKNLLLLFSFVAITSIALGQTFGDKKIYLRDNNSIYKNKRYYKINASSDENNYYIAYQENKIIDESYWASDEIIPKKIDKNINLIIADKDFINHKKVTLEIEKNEIYHTMLFNNDNIILICSRYDSKSKETDITLKRYSKGTGTFINSSTLATFPTNMSEHFYIAISPDKTKCGFVAFVANKDKKYDRFYECILNIEEYEITRKSVQSLDISKSTFGISDVAINNDDVMFVALYSKTDERKSVDEYYIDGKIIGENFTENFSYKLDGELIDGKIKVLRNNNFLFACIASNPNLKGKDYGDPGFFKTAIYDVEKREINENKSWEIPKLEYQKKPALMKLTLNIDNIKELDNNELAIVMQQARDVTIYSNRGNGKVSYRGSILTTFATKDGYIQNYNIYNKFQVGAHNRNVPMYSFLKGNTLYCIFNECAENLVNTSKMKNFDYKAKKVIVCSKFTNGEKPKLFCITDKSGKDDRYFQGVVLHDENDKDKFIILTATRKTVDLEILNIKE